MEDQAASQTNDGDSTVLNPSMGDLSRPKLMIFINYRFKVIKVPYDGDYEKSKFSLSNML